MSDSGAGSTSLTFDMSSARQVLLTVTLFWSITPGQEPTAAGVTETGRAPLRPGAVAGVVHPEPPIYRLGERGVPMISEAGYLQLADEGPGFYYGALLPDRVPHTRPAGIIGTNNWGDPESLCLAGRIVTLWREVHPEVRLGLDEISGRYGGFPDYDRDGISDHLTHQLGMNINFLVPCRERPERSVHLGVRNEQLFDPELFSDLLDLLATGGAIGMTTNRALLSVPGEPGRLRSRQAWKELSRLDNGYSINYGLEGSPVRLLLLEPVGDHADHINCLLWRPD
jgi:hypothetical protein